jgi:hypothetical protein
MTDTPARRRRERPPRPIERAEIVIAVVLLAVGALWGAALQRTAALTDIAAVAPILMVVLGPGALIVYLGYRAIKGNLELRMDGFGTIALVVGAIVGNVLTPGLAPMATVPGRMTGTLDGTALDLPGACTWGAGHDAVIRVAVSLPEHIPPPAGDTGGSFSTNVPTGTLTLELPAGSVVLSDIPDGFGVKVLPLRNGTGGAGTGDRSSGSVTLEISKGAVVDGQLSWTCPQVAGS